jgi:hypothetical protein
MLEAIGLDVPEEVSTALDFTDVNIQKQHDAPFLLSESPGEVARFFNKIVHFDAIDKYLSSVESKKRKTKADTEMSKGNADRLAENISTYSWIGPAEKLLACIAEQDEAVNNIHDKELAKELQDYTTNRDRCDTLITVIDSADTLCEKIAKKVPILQTLVVQSKRLQESLTAYKHHADIVALDTGTTYAEKLVRKIDRQRPLVSELSKACSALEEAIRQYTHAKQNIREYTELIAEHTKSLPSVCPTCGKEL